MLPTCSTQISRLGVNFGDIPINVSMQSFRGRPRVLTRSRPRSNRSARCVSTTATASTSTSSPRTALLSMSLSMENSVICV